MNNLSTLASVGTGITALSGLVLVTPTTQIGYQPQPYNSVTSPNTPPVLPTILFHYEGEQTLSMESDITDHYVEDNTALQDQIALKPLIITTQGFVGELNNVTPESLSTAKTIANKLGAISAYTPALSATALLAYNQALQAYQSISNAQNAAVSAAASLPDSDFKNKASDFLGTQQTSLQQKYFQQFYGYWNARFLFTVQTPWAIIPDCAIMSMKAVQDESTKLITDFNITFKQLKFAKTKVSKNSKSVQAQLNAQIQASSPVSAGTQTANTSANNFSVAVK